MCCACVRACAYVLRGLVNRYVGHMENFLMSYGSSTPYLLLISTAFPPSLSPAPLHHPCAFCKLLGPKRSCSVTGLLTSVFHGKSQKRFFLSNCECCKHVVEDWKCLTDLSVA